MSLRREYIDSPLPIKDDLLSFFNKDSKIIIFDIGACEAEDSIRYSLLFPEAHIYAFEPNPENISLAKKNIEVYKKSNIQIIEEALSDKVGIAEFYISSGNPNPEKIIEESDWDFGNKSSSILPPGKIKQTHDWLKFNKKISVRTDTIGNFAKRKNIQKIDFVHMDVQGAELKVLKGAGKFISNIKLIWLEVSTLELYKNQALQKHVERFLKKNGFVLIKNSMSGFAGDQLYFNTKHDNNTNMYTQALPNSPRNIFKRIFSRKNIDFAFQKKSYSQSGEDLIVRFIFETIGIKNPSYIDIGAHHPFHINNTAIFYHSGSKGINIEPNPDNIGLFFKFREKDINLNIGIGEKEEVLDYYKLSSSTLNTFSKTEAEKYRSDGYHLQEVIKVKVTPLETVINEFANGVFPDFLSIDVEGMDQQILSSIDFHKNAPIVICIETISFSENGRGVKNKNIISFLEGKGFFVYADTYINTIFVRTDKWIK